MSSETLQAVAYDPSHVGQMTLKSNFTGEQEWVEAIDSFVANPCAITKTIVAPSGPIAVVGLIKRHSRMAEVWSLTSTAVYQYPFGFHRIVKKLLADYAKTLGLKRLYMTVREDFEEAQKWACALGFQPEGLLRAFGPDESNYYLFARIER